MRTNFINSLENDINNTLEMSSICRGEWCRSLESEVDELRYQVTGLSRSDIGVEDSRIKEMSNKIQTSYRNLSPDIHV